MDFIIGITTFSKRKNFLINLIDKIRNFTEKKILVCINGELGGNTDEEYTIEILNFFSSHKNVYPIFFTEIRGLSKLWNTIAIHSCEENILMLNDDLDLSNPDIFEIINSHLSSKNYKGFTRINRSFSHFIISKKVLDSLGYFDERLLGFGEEDGDIFYRCLKQNFEITDISISGFINLISDVRHENIKPGIGKYSKFNRDFVYQKKYSANKDSKLKGMFDTPMVQNLEDINCYPYESFFHKNKKDL